MSGGKERSTNSGSGSSSSRSRENEGRGSQAAGSASPSRGRENDAGTRGSGAGSSGNAGNAGSAGNGRSTGAAGRSASTGGTSTGRSASGANGPSRSVGGGLGSSTGAAGRTASTGGVSSSRAAAGSRSVGGGLAGASGLAGPVSGGNISSTRQTDPKSSNAASAAARRESTARAGTTIAGRPDTPIGSLPAARAPSSATGFGPIGDMAANALGAVKNAVGPTFNSAMTYNKAIDGFMDRMIEVESGGNPNAKNPLSTATGLGQFISGTWNSTVAKYRPDLARLPRDERLALRKDPVLARQMTKAYAIENAKALQKAGIPITKESVYAAHFLGSVGARKAYNADPTTPAVDVLGSAAVKANPSVMRGKTIGDVLGYVDKVMNRAPRQNFARTPDSVGVPAARPSMAERFTNTYLGAARPAGPVSSNLTNPADRPQTRPSRELMSDQEQAAVYGEQPGGIPIGSEGSLSPNVADGTPISPSVGSQPVPQAIDSTRPVAPVESTVPVRPVQSQPLAPSEETTVKVPLTTGQQIAAGAIDIGTGLIPGVGMGISIYNGLATVAGIPTVGQMAVDLLGDQSNLGTGGIRRNGESGARRDYVPPEEPAPSEETTKPPEKQRFRETYLIPTIRRPTPSEKWSRNRQPAA